MARSKGNKPAADFSLLTEEDKTRIAFEAHEIVAAERRKEAEKAYLEGALSEERREVGLEEELLTDVLTLAEHSDRVVLDGRAFFHGITYTLPRSVWQVLKEVESRGWIHHYETKEGKSRVAQKPRDIRISPANPAGVVNTSQFMRA